MRFAIPFLIVTLPGSACADDSKKPDVRNPRQVIEAYVTAALTGKTDDAIALAVEGQSAARKKRIEEMKALLDVPALRIAGVHASEKAAQALALSEKVKLTKAQPDGRDSGCLLFTLIKRKDRWLVKDVDFRSQENAGERVQTFLKQNPDTKEIPVSPKK